MISQYPFQLKIVWRNDKIQFRLFESATMMMEAAKALRPALVKYWQASVIIEEKLLEENLQNRG
jgi:hypothetical protein